MKKILSLLVLTLAMNFLIAAGAGLALSERPYRQGASREDQGGRLSAGYATGGKHATGC